jgi:hypothetical protein
VVRSIHFHSLKQEVHEVAYLLGSTNYSSRVRVAEYVVYTTFTHMGMSEATLFSKM